MKNKLYSLLILLIVFWSIIWFILYFYVLYTWSLTTSANINSFNIKLKSDSIKKSYDFTCEKSICNYEDLPPVEFYYIASADWYNTVTWFITVISNSNSDLKLFFDKQISIIEDLFAKKEKIKAIIAANKKTKEERLDEVLDLSKMKKFFKYYDFWDKWKYVLKKEESWLVLYDFWKDLKLYSFDLYNEDEIEVYDILWINNIAIHAGEILSIYNLNNWDIIKKDFSPKIDYIKYEYDKKEYLIKTSKWTFVYSVKTWDLNYFYLFDDFTYINNNIIWSISSDDTRRINNYNISINREVWLFIYNNFTKEKDKILELDYKISKIYNRDWEIIVSDDKGEEFIIKNIDK